MADDVKKYSDAGMALLKANLGHYGSVLPNDLEIYLRSLMEYAAEEFARMGIRLEPGKISDDMDQMTFAAWMYRKGVNGDGKTEMLKSIINNRKVADILADAEGGA